MATALLDNGADATSKPVCPECDEEMGKLDEADGLQCANCECKTHYSCVKGLTPTVVAKIRQLPQFAYFCHSCYMEAAADKAGIMRSALSQETPQPQRSRSACKHASPARGRSCSPDPHSTPLAVAAKADGQAAALTRRNQQLERKLEDALAEAVNLRSERDTERVETAALRLELEDARKAAPTPAAQSVGEDLAGEGPAAGEQLPAATYSGVRMFHGEWDPLSMFYQFEAAFQDDRFTGKESIKAPTGEHLYGYAKAVLHKNDGVARKLITAKSAPHAGAAKSLHRVIETNEDWDEASDELMRKINELKFEQCEPFRRELFESGSMQLAHSLPHSLRNPKKEKWSTALDNQATRACATADGKFPGRNVLGSLLMSIREEKKVALAEEAVLKGWTVNDKSIEKPKPALDTGSSQLECWRCGERGHIKRHCRQPASFSCWSCNQQGHKAAACPTPNLQLPFRRQSHAQTQGGPQRRPPLADDSQRGGGATRHGGMRRPLLANDYSQRGGGATRHGDARNALNTTYGTPFNAAAGARHGLHNRQPQRDDVRVTRGATGVSETPVTATTSPPLLSATAPPFVPGVCGASGSQSQSAVPDWKQPMDELRTELSGQLNTLISYVTSNLVPDSNVNAVRAPSYLSAARIGGLATRV
jgi:ribA/ribD-fused uncharacterized protein